MLKLFSCISKETKLLYRDPAGLAILFLLPVVMVFIITIIQDSALHSLSNQPMEVLIVDNDQQLLGHDLTKELNESRIFAPRQPLKNEFQNEAELINEVKKGKFKIAVIIDSGSTDILRQTAVNFIETSFFSDSNSIQLPKRKIRTYFDPTIQFTFKNSLAAIIEALVQRTQSEIITNAMAQKLKEFLPMEGEIKFPKSTPIELEQDYASDSTIRPNSVQHNVPAWSIFAMFFIVIPLGTNLVREKESGIIRRLFTLPNAFLPSLFSKLFVYTVVGFLQFILMFLIGIYILPKVGLPELQIGDNFFLLALMSVVCAVAGVSFGLMIGSLASSHEQSASFGSIIVVIMAAMGGIWVPSFVMPPIFKLISSFSPMNWALNGFYDILLRDAGLHSISGYLVKLLIFALISFGVAVAANLKLYKIFYDR